jgi:hypothetical protein
MSGVEYKVQDASMWQLHLDVTGAPDTTHPDQPGGAIRPEGVSMGVGITNDVWSVSAANVFGQKVKDGKVVTKRNYPLPFLSPLDEDSDAPEWLRKICQDWVDKANGGAEKPVSSVEISRRVRRSPQRASFDMALNVLLIRENLDGTEWAIERLRESAAAAAKAAEATPKQGFEDIERTLRLAAENLEKDLDKRAAELATREH